MLGLLPEVANISVQHRCVRQRLLSRQFAVGLSADPCSKRPHSSSSGKWAGYCKIHSLCLPLFPRAAFPLLLSLSVCVNVGQHLQVPTLPGYPSLGSAQNQGVDVAAGDVVLCWAQNHLRGPFQPQWFHDSRKGVKIRYFLLASWSALWNGTWKPSACYFDVSVIL